MHPHHILRKAIKYGNSRTKDNEPVSLNVHIVTDHTLSVFLDGAVLSFN